MTLPVNTEERMRPRVLLVEDSFALSETYQVYLKSEGYHITCVETGRAAMEIIAKDPPDVAILDVHLPDMSGIDILKEVKARGAPTDIIIITGRASVNLAVDAMREGAADFIMKPFTAERLRITVGNATERHTLSARIEQYKEELRRDRFIGFVGCSPAMQAVYHTLENAALSDATVFVSGESGTGKELCVEALHKLSRRKNGPLITLNCAAIPRDLLESEIFGHVKGAFTGATRDRRGAALRANGGTLFLDEICEMDLSLQAKLLRFVQERVVHRVGDDVAHPADIRIICATNRDPMDEVQARRFREDLFYRLHVVPVVLPPLRGRSEDVLLIANHFLQLFAAEDGKSFSGFSDDCKLALMTYHWPGNVRQLQNLVRQMVVMNTGGMINHRMLPAELATIDQSAERSIAGFHDRPSASFSNIIQSAEAKLSSSEIADNQGSAEDVPGEFGSLPKTYTFGTENPIVDQFIGQAYQSAVWYQKQRGEAFSFLPNVPEISENKDYEDISRLEDVIRNTVDEAIRICNGSIPKAARALDVSPSTIYRRLQAWAIDDAELYQNKDDEAA